MDFSLSDKKYIQEMETRKGQNQLSQNILLLLFSVTGLLIISQNFLLIPLSDQLQQTFHVQNSSVFLGTSIFSFCYAVGFLIWSIVVKRFGRRKVLLIGLLLTAVSTFELGFTNSYVLFCLLRGLQGFVSATFTPIALNYSLELFSENKMIWVSTIFTSSSIFSQLIAQISIEYVTISQGFIFAGLMMGGLTLAFFHLPPENIKLQEPFPTRWEIKQLVVTLLKNKNRWLFGMVLIQFLYFVVTIQLIDKLAINHNIAISHITIQLVSLVGMLMPTAMAATCKKLCKNQFLLFIPLIQLGFILLLFSHLGTLYMAIFIISFAISSMLPLLIKEIGFQNQDNQAYGMAGYTFFYF
jgi:MFS family permease